MLSQEHAPPPDIQDANLNNDLVHDVTTEYHYKARQDLRKNEEKNGQ